MAVLETTFVIDLMKESKLRRDGAASAKLKELTARKETLSISIFTVAELHVGVAKGTQPDQERLQIQRCLSLFGVLQFRESTAELFGVVVGKLEKHGQPISAMDALIASTALEHSELLVTRNLKHFQRIPGLQVEGY